MDRILLHFRLHSLHNKSHKARINLNPAVFSGRQTKRSADMMRLVFFCSLIAALLSFTVFIFPSFAVGPGKVMQWEAPSSPGKVSVDGKIHAEKGMKCMECHTKVWPMKKGTSMKMEEMNAGKYCGVCHNGNNAFSTSDEGSCSKCHQKQ